MIEIRNVSFRYTQKPVLNDISFSVTKGQLCGLFGPNGSGKTTLFKCCLKFLPVQEGSITLNRTNIQDKPIEELAKSVAYVPQEHKPPFPYLAREIVLMGRTPHIHGFFGVKRKDKQIAKDAMDMVGMLPFSDEPYNQLSGGQRQMILMARALAQDTPLLLLDEPTSALDFQNQIRIWNLMEDIVSEGKTILACSHDPNHISWFCDSAVAISQNKIIAEGEPKDVICPDILDRMYRDTCSVHVYDGIPVVIPCSVTKRNDTVQANLANLKI
nr:ABC transporter ATP-binding protein [uncultured Methanospirillum sp.]